MKKLICNKIKCNQCGAIIESTHVHDFKWCPCHSVAVDGGHNYAKRCYTENATWTELSEWEEDAKDEENCCDFE